MEVDFSPPSTPEKMEDTTQEEPASPDFMEAAKADVSSEEGVDERMGGMDSDDSVGSIDFAPNAIENTCSTPDVEIRLDFGTSPIGGSVRGATGAQERSAELGIFTCSFPSPPLLTDVEEAALAAALQVYDS